MSTTVSAFDTTLQHTNEWLRDLGERMNWNDDRQRSYHAFRAVLHALRDRLPVDEAVALAAQLPLLLRGMYYEGWRPNATPVKDRTKEAFLSHIEPAFRDDLPNAAEGVTRAVFGVIASHVSGGEIEGIVKNLPRELHDLWD
jgi:uncharacterized protein (DUF2267 family)